MNFPIDIVYTWVNSNDPVWEEKKNKALGQHQQGFIGETSKERYRDNNELKYSLRSVEKYAPWVRKIFIVTDQQKPHWLNTKHKKIKIIDHKDIFPSDSNLPTFNSMAIEGQLHNIPNLSEHYLYFNDDLFLGNLCYPHYFFNKEKEPFIFVEKRKVPFIKRILILNNIRFFEKNTHHSSINNSRLLVKKITNKIIWDRMHHGIKPFNKSICLKLEETFHEEFKKTTNSQFRDFSNILISGLFSFFCLAQKIGKAKTLVFPKILKKKILSFDKYALYIPTNRKNVKKMLAKIKKTPPFQFSINDMPGTKEETLLECQKFLEEMFPNPSSFER